MTEGESVRILIAVDLSDATAVILEQVRPLAACTGAQVWLLHVADPDPDFLGYEPGPQTVRDQVADEMRRKHRHVQGAAEAWRAAGLDVTPLQVQGPIAETVLAEAKRLAATLIVVGSHGHGAVFQLLVGSVSERILQHATCPVLVVPTHKRHE